MAGDIGITEAAIYVKPDEKASDTQLEQALRPTRARVIHRFGPRLAIAEVPEGGDVQETREYQEGKRHRERDGDL